MKVLSSGSCSSLAIPCCHSTGQDWNSRSAQHLCSLALQLYLSAETQWVHKKSEQQRLTQKAAKLWNCSLPSRRACAGAWKQSQLLVIEHRKPLSHKVLEATFAFKGTSKTCLPCSYTLIEAVTAGHCQRQADGLEQPMAWPGLLQQCSLLFWVTVYSRGTASSRRLLCHCWIIYPTPPPMAGQEEGRKRIAAGEICQERGREFHFHNLVCFCFLGLAEKKEHSASTSSLL